MTTNTQAFAATEPMIDAGIITELTPSQPHNQIPEINMTPRSIEGRQTLAKINLAKRNGYLSDMDEAVTKAGKFMRAMRNEQNITKADLKSSTIKTAFGAVATVIVGGVAVMMDQSLQPAATALTVLGGIGTIREAVKMGRDRVRHRDAKHDFKAAHEMYAHVKAEQDHRLQTIEMGAPQQQSELGKRHAKLVV